MSELLTLKVLNNVLTGKLDYCTLCFKPIDAIDNDLHMLKDEIIAEKYNHTQIIGLLSQILDNKSLDSPLANNAICKSCTISTIKCYEFINMCKENFKRLNKVVETVSDSLEKYKKQLLDHKSIFISVNSTDMTCQLYYWAPKKPVVQKSLPPTRSKYVVQVKHRNRKNNDDFSDYDEDFGQATTIVSDTLQKEDVRIKKTEKKKKEKSKKIPTSEMRYDENGFKCKTCLREFRNNSSLRTHYFSVHAEKIAQCTKCPRKFGRHSILAQHMRDFHVPVICTECGKLYQSKHALNQHEVKHKLNLICPHCERVYKDQKLYNEHVDLKKCQIKKAWNMHRKQPNNKLICDYCKKEYTCKTVLIAHIGFEHGNVKGYTCTWCSKRFISKSGLNYHTMKHTQEKKYSCDTCGLKFQTKMTLRAHRRLHTGEKPFSCHLCEKSFTSSVMRSTHIMKHHLPPKNECDICHRKFTTATCLKKHKERHFDPKGRLFKRTNSSKMNTLAE